MSFTSRLRARLLHRSGLAVQARVDAQLDEVRSAIGELQARLPLASLAEGDLTAAEYKVFSQWGEDGILQHLASVVPIDEPVFVEIGVGDYRESNTRFLVQHSNWRGLIVDGGGAHVDFMRTSNFGWRYSVDALQAFVTRGNVNQLITDAGVTGDIGLLSIDVDGVDWWLWEAVQAVQARILVAEYNALWGPTAAVTVPYDDAFSCSAAHPSQQYFGTSLAALHHLLDGRGYQLVGVGRHGVNAFFVRRDVGAGLPDLLPQEAYRPGWYRTERDASGALTLSNDRVATLRTLRALPLWVVDEQAERTVGEVYGVG